MNGKPQYVDASTLDVGSYFFLSSVPMRRRRVVRVVGSNERYAMSDRCTLFPFARYADVYRQVIPATEGQSYEDALAAITPKSLTFGDLANGDLFRCQSTFCTCGDTVYVKRDADGYVVANASGGVANYVLFDDSLPVTRVNATFEDAE